MLNRAWLALGCVSLASTPLYKYQQVSLLLAAGAALTFTVVQLMLYRGKTRFACFAFCVGVDLVFFTMFLALAKQFGMMEAFRTQGPVLMLMGVTVLFASALLGARAGFAVAAINTLIIVGLRLLFAPEADPRPSAIVFGWLLASVAFLYERNLSEVFAELRNVRLDLEAKVSERTRDLNESVARLEALTEQLQSANTDLELFSASVAHDLRAPLRVIEGYSRVLQDLSSHSPEVAQAVQRMLDVERRMNRLLEGLLLFARLGHHALRKQCVDMQELVRRTGDELREQESPRTLEIEIGELPACNADPILIEQVVVNLLSNACKFTRPRAVARIVISGREQDGDVVYSIRDNGVGFAMEQGSRLFNTLQRLHPQDEFEGSGIGLAMVQRIVRRHDGRVWAHSKVNDGAEFFFALPQSASQQDGRIG